MKDYRVRKNTIIHIRITEDLKDRLFDAAAKEEKYLSEVLRELIERKVEEANASN